MELELSALYGRTARGSNIDRLYEVFCKTMKKEMIPLLQKSLSSDSDSDSVLSSRVNKVLQFILTFYELIEQTADHNTISHLLSTSWRNSVETPFLLLGDVHPYVVTNLLRSLMEGKIEDSGLNSFETFNASNKDRLNARIDQIEDRTTRMVPALLNPMKIAYRNYVAQVGEKWINKKATPMVDEVLTTEERDVLLKLFGATNALRRSLLSESIQYMNVHQRTWFLLKFCQIIGDFDYHNPGAFLDPLPSSGTDLNKEKRDEKVLISNFVSGVMAAPSMFILLDAVSRKELLKIVCIFASRLIGAARSTFTSSMFKGRSPFRSTQDAFWAFLCFLIGGLVPVLCGVKVSTRWVKIMITVALTSLLIALVLVWEYVTRTNNKKKVWKNVLIFAVCVAAIGFTVGLADLVNHI